MTTVVIDGRCTACGQCLATCPTRALVAAPRKPAVVDARCTGCGACLEICPTDAISESRSPLIHPIELDSYRILAERIDLSHLPPLTRAVVERVIHASADLEYADTMVAPEDAVSAAVRAVAGGHPVVTDVEMTRVGITGVEARCYLGDATADGGLTRSAAALRIAARRHPDGAVVVIGCAPTALSEALALAAAGRFAPAAIIALPVGFAGAAASKEAARRSGLPVISNVGDKGGSAVAAAACNAIIRIARG